MLPLLTGMDLINIWRYRKTISMRFLLVLVPGGLVGIVIGALTWQYLDEESLGFGIGSLALLFAAQYFIARGRRKQLKKMSEPMGVVMGALGGFTSFVTHAGGPPVNAYVLTQGADKSVVMSTNIYYFFIINAVKLYPYFLLGQFSSDNLHVSLYLAPMIPVGVFVGYYLHRLVSQQMFTLIAYVLLVATGVKLIFDGVLGLA